MFSTWFSRQISLGTKNGVELDNIEVGYLLSVLKPLHAKWLVELYNHMSTDEGNEIVANGWKKVGIFDPIKFALSGLRISPFMWKPEFIDPLSRRIWLFSRENPGKWWWFWWLLRTRIDDDGNEFGPLDDSLWLVLSKKVSILLECMF